MNNTFGCLIGNFKKYDGAMKICSRSFLWLFLPLLLGSVDVFAEDSRAWLEDQIRILTGKSEELERRVAEMERELQSLRDMLKYKADEETEKKSSTLISGKTAEDVLKMARDIIDDGNTRAGRDILLAFVKNNPKNIYCGLMLFYVGESYFREKDYQNAVKEYKNGYTINPNGSKAAETLYKLAICFQKLAKAKEARKIIDKLCSDYPTSAVVPRAKKLRSELSD